MTIDFGYIIDYKLNGGYGFVSCSLYKFRKKVFFHITNLQKVDNLLACKIQNKNEDTDKICFWYQAENTPKGYAVKEIWLSCQGA